MEAAAIQKALDVHKRAYALLMWLKSEAPSQISQLSGAAEERISPASCEEWFFQNSSNIPASLRPGKQEQSAFFHMFSSFFSASFHLEGERGKSRSLERGGRAITGRRHKRNARKRDEANTQELERLAVRDLCQATGLAINDDLERAALENSEIAGDLALWTYVRELVRRTEFTSQGPAVHRLWLSLDEHTRKDLSAPAALRAKSRLLAWISGKVDQVS